MATPATDLFKKLYREYGYRHVTALAQIDLQRADGSGVDSIYVGSARTRTPEGAMRGGPFQWDEMIVGGVKIDAPGQILTADPSLCSSSLTLERRKLGFQPDGQDLFDSLATHVWQGSRVWIYLWMPELPDFDQALMVFPGGPIEDWDQAETSLKLYLRQAVDWNGQVQTGTVTKRDYPNAPEATLNAPKPTVLGRIPAIAYRPPHAGDWGKASDVRFWPVNFPNERQNLERLLGGRRVHQGILVDTGRTSPTAKAKVILAGHKLTAFGHPESGYGLFVEQEGKLIPFDLPGGGGGFFPGSGSSGDVFNTDQESGFLIPNPWGWFYAGALPAVDAPGSAADTPKAVLEPENDIAFADLDAAAGTGSLRLTFDALPILGVASNIYLIASSYLRSGYCQVDIAGPAALGAPNTFFLQKSGSTQYHATFIAQDVFLLASAFAGTTDYFTRLNELAITVGVNVACRIYDIGILVQYGGPQRDQIVTRRLVRSDVTRPLSSARGRAGQLAASSVSAYETKEVLPPVTELQGNFFANVAGWPDDGSGGGSAGDITGTPGAVIERAPDLIHLLLRRFGGLTADDLELASGVHGSFPDARAAFRTWRLTDMVFGIGLNESQDVMTVLSWIANAATAWAFPSRFDGRWKMISWDGQNSEEYDLEFEPDDITETQGPRVYPVPAAKLISAIRIPYGWDAFTKQYLHEVYVSPGRSSGGFKYMNIRDQSLEIALNANDRIDIRYPAITGTTTTIQLAAAVHTFASIYQEFYTKLSNPHVLGRKWAFAFGGVTFDGCQDLYFGEVPLIDHVTSIPDGERSLEEHAAVVQDTMNATSTGYTVTYSRATRKFTISRAGGNFRLDFDSTNKSAAAGLGFEARPYTGAASYTSTFEVEDRVFAISCNAAVDILWRSGPNGFISATRRSAAEPLGFEEYEDVPNQTFHFGRVPKGVLEDILLAAVKRYVDSDATGPARRDFTVEGRAIWDTDTALELRARLARLAGRGSGRIIEFGTDRAPDLERGRIIRMSPKFDEIKKYPDPDSDGSWAGKRFLVFSAGSQIGPTTCETRVQAWALQ